MQNAIHNRRHNLRARHAALACALLLAGCGAARTNEHGSLFVEARTVGGGETLRLLDADPIRLPLAPVKEGEVAQARAHLEHPRLQMLAGLMDARRRAAYPLGPDIALLLEQSRPLWETHVVRTARTDERGRAVFDKLAPGHYWLMCLAERDGKLAFWSPRVTVERGAAQALVLDQSNALTLSDKPAR